MTTRNDEDVDPQEPFRLTTFLRTVDVFRDLDEDAAGELAMLLAEKLFAAEDVIFRHDQAADALYLVRHGAVTLFRDEIGKPLQLLARYKAGDYFGELGLFDGSERRATARATEPTLLLAGARDAVLEFLNSHPQVALRLHTAAARRHSENVAAVLGVGPRDEVRIRVDREISMRLSDGTFRRVTLENLSNGGLSLANAPASWRPPGYVRFVLDLVGEELEVEGRVSWRSGSVLGIAFTGKSAVRDEQVQRALRRLLFQETAS